MANSANTEQVKYKAVSGRMCDYFGFKLCDDGTVYSAENVFCLICYKSFAYHGSNTSLGYHLQRAHPIQHRQLLDKAPAKKSSVPSSTGQIGHFFNRNDRVVSDKVQQDIKKSLAQWIATAGRPTGGLGERLSSPSGSQAEPGRQTFSGAYRAENPASGELLS